MAEKLKFCAFKPLLRAIDDGLPRACLGLSGENIRPFIYGISATTHRRYGKSLFSSEEGVDESQKGVGTLATEL